MSRLLYGTAVALTIGFVAVTIGLVAGGAIGLVAAYKGGKVDSVLMRLMDILLAFPGLLLALAVITFLGPGVVNTMIAIGIGAIPGYARLIRGDVLSFLARDHVLAARSLGAGDVRLMVKHLLPLAIPSILVFSSAQLARAILTEAGLLPGAGGAAAGPFLGQHDRDGPALLPELAIHGHLPGPGHHGHGLRAQSARRQLARCARPTSTRQCLTRISAS